MTTAEKTSDDAATIEALAIQFARLQMEHQSRTDEDAARISREAIRGWGERVPAALADRPRAAK